MPNPGDPVPSAMSSEESFLELLAETIENLDRPARAQFLQRFFKTLAQLELTDAASLEYWEQIVRRRRELAESLEKPVSLRTAIVEVLASSSHLRVPVLMEYEELKKLQINAATDPLTGLYNRRLFEDHFERELNRALRYNQHLAVVMLDLHQFKEVNDRYGHARGDLLLRTVATTLRKSLRTSDYAFRIGGDEFALLLVQSDKDQATTLANRVRTNFAASTQSLQMPSVLGLDYGLAVYPEDGDQKEVLLRVADERLYEMKHAEAVIGTAGTGAAPPRPSVPSRPTAPAASVFEAARPPILKPPGGPPPLSAATRREQRKWERVQLAGTRAYAQLSDRPQTARVIDLGYGGVGLEFNAIEEVSTAFEAVLHVPILPPVRVNLKPLYQVRTPSGNKRVGCAFVT
jgi:diguanylate cyclase (GGDEF)-like protein